MSEIEEFLSKHVSRISTAPVHNTSFGLCPRMSPARRSYVNELSGTSEQVAQKPFHNIVSSSQHDQSAFKKKTIEKHVSVESPPTFTEKEPYLWYRRSVRQNGGSCLYFQEKECFTVLGLPHRCFLQLAPTLEWGMPPHCLIRVLPKSHEHCRRCSPLCHSLCFIWPPRHVTARITLPKCLKS